MIYKACLTTILIPLCLSLTSHASLIGHEQFNTDGAIAGQTGGIGFGWDHFSGDVQTGTVSDWDTLLGAPSVSGGVLTTSGSSAKREYNGTIEGAGGGDGSDTERAGGYRGTGIVYLSIDMTPDSTGGFSGISSYDFGTERVFFGHLGTGFYGISESGVGSNLSAVPAVGGETVTIVGKVDFDGDLLSMWLNPVAGGEGANTPIVTRAFTGTNWSTPVRIASGGGVTSTWDDLRVGTTFNDVVDVVPEPQSVALVILGALMLVRRSKR